MPLVFTKKPIDAIEVQAAFNIRSEALEEPAMLAIMHKRAIKRAYLKLDAGKEFVKTAGYGFAAGYIVHTNCPGAVDADEQEQLVSLLYSRCLSYAWENSMQTVALPLCYRAFDALTEQQVYQEAKSAIEQFFKERNLTVYLCLQSEAVISVYDWRVESIDKAIQSSCPPAAAQAFKGTVIQLKPVSQESGVRYSFADFPTAHPLTTIINNMKSETFSQMLLRIIDEKQITDVSCYKKANIERSLFSKIKSNKFYKPSKMTVIALAIALELDINQARELLYKAGYTLSDSIVFDVIITYVLSRQIYNINEVNEILFAYGQPTLGTK